MKKLLYLLIAITLSCSSDDDNDGAVSGCTDPESVNYNSNATVDDNSCQYSIIGEWNITKYTLGAVNVRAGYTSLNVTYFSDNTMLTSGVTTNGIVLSVIGTFSFSGSNNSTLTLINEFGDISVFTVLDISSNFVKINSSNVGGEEADIEALRL